MRGEHHSRVRRLFDQAMELTAAERRGFVEREAPPGDAVRDELLAMIQGDDGSADLSRTCTAGVGDQPPAAHVGLPAQIGAYKILRPVGRGGMGIVYLALRNDDVFQKVVALKVIGGAARIPEADLVTRFKQERQILADLDHPNIARILDGGDTDDGHPFYVMEYVDGSPIDEYCTRMNTDLPSRVRMIAEVCDAVAYLHRHAIAHRDIKPHNILVSLDGTVKLVDFGIAKVDSAGLLRAGAPGGEPTMIMTPGYASPEQIAGDASGRLGDIYSIGAVLYQLLTGRLPHAGRDGRADLGARVAGTPPRPPSHELMQPPKTALRRPDSGKLSIPDLDRVVLTALERDPLRRYATVLQFGDDLRRCLDGRPITARPATATYRARKAMARNPVVTAMAAAALLTAAGGAWLAAGARIERVRVDAKEQELERFVDMLARKVDGWQGPGQPVPVTERVADIRAASAILVSDTMRTLADRAADPPRVRRAIQVLGQVLQRADTAAPTEPELRKEIAVALRRMGDVESAAGGGQLADRDDAARSYRRAAEIAATLRDDEGDWADQQIAELSQRLIALGVSPGLPFTEQVVAAAEPPPGVARMPAAATVAASLPSSPPGEIVVQSAPELAPEEVVARDAARQRLRATELSAARARRNFAALRDSLAARGLATRADVEGLLVHAEQLLEDARGAVDANDLLAAEDAMRRAGYQLDRVFEAVGR